MNYDYIIVGGGIAGLNTALKLCDTKNKILLLERNSRLGGRLHTFKEKKILYEAGGARFHKGQKNLFELIKMFNLENDIFEIPNTKKFLPIKNKYSDKYQLNNILKNLIHKSTNHKKEELLKMNLLEFCEKVYDKKTASFLSAAFEYVTELEDVNAYEAIEIFQNDMSDDFQFYLFKNGFGSLLDKMEEFIKDNNCTIKTQHTLMEFEKNKDTFTIDVISGKKMMKFKTPTLILALDKSALEKLPYLSPIKKELNSVQMIPLLRIYAVYPPDPKTKKVWFDGMEKVVTDLEIKYIIPLDYKSGLIMISYTDQRLAEYWNKFIKQGPEKLEKELLRQLNLLFPKKKIPKTTFLKSHYWYNGACYWKKNQEAESIAKKILKPFETDNLYICGSNYSQRQAWTEGALETSEEVIKLIHGIKENKKLHHITKTMGGGSKNKTKKMKKYTRKEVAKHNSPADLWIIINKKVLDVTQWQHSHPGSPAPLQEFGGKDATKAFMARGHSSNAKKIMKQYIIGKV
jgi:cytochrome b involved in lipid metabolism/protoporphyrinogen oxidase